MTTANQAPSTLDSKLKLGMKFPFQRGPQGFPAPANPHQLIYEHISSLLLTSKNERVMNTEQGVYIHSYVFENMTLITQARLSSVVSRAIGTYIPEALILNVIGSVRKNADGTKSTLVIETQYRVGNQDFDQQVPIPLDQLTGGQ